MRRLKTSVSPEYISLNLSFPVQEHRSGLQRRGNPGSFGNKFLRNQLQGVRREDALGSANKYAVK